MTDAVYDVLSPWAETDWRGDPRVRPRLRREHVPRRPDVRQHRKCATHRHARAGRRNERWPRAVDCANGRQCGVHNIEETSVARLKVGQQVNVHVDALGTDVPGRIESITPATAASFSLLPTSNSSGNFTKVTQLVPVRISVNLGNQPVLLGSSVEVKVRVA